MSACSRWRWRRRSRGAGQAGATSLEWTLLVGAIAVPAYFVITAALDLLVEHYRMMTTLNALPFP